MALADFQSLTSRINLLGLFSPNENFNEISVRNATYMLVPYCMGEIRLRVRTTENEDRMDLITRAMVSAAVSFPFSGLDGFLGSPEVLYWTS